MNNELLLFVEKAHKLEASPFWKWVSNRRGPSDIERIVAGDWLAHDGLTAEALDSFCLTLRLLIQDRDGFSIRKISERATIWAERHSCSRDEIRRAVETLNSQLSKRSLVQFLEGKITTNKDVFDVIFYGGIVHANPGKRDQFSRLAKSGLFSLFVFQSFTHVLFHYRNCIQTIAFNVVQYLENEGCHARES